MTDETDSLDEMGELLGQLSPSQRRKFTFYLRWLVFRQQFSSESLRADMAKLRQRIALRAERIQLGRERPLIAAEINELWKAAKEQLHLPFIPSADASKEIAAVKRSLNLDLQAQKHLQPWLYIFDQGVVWLTCFYFAYQEGEKGQTKWMEPIEFLLATAGTQATAIRLLCAEGLEIPAKTILRSFLESLLTCTALMQNEELRRTYKEQHEPDEARRLWKTHLRMDSLLANMQEILLEHGVEDNIRQDFAKWVREEITVASQAVHVSYTLAALGAMPPPVDQKSYFPGLFGVPTIMSRRTLMTASTFLWFFSMVCMRLLLLRQHGDENALLKLRPRTKQTKLAAASYRVFFELVQNHAGETVRNQPPEPE